MSKHFIWSCYRRAFRAWHRTHCRQATTGNASAVRRLQTLSHTDFICFPPKKYKFAIPLTWELARRLNNLFTSLLNRNPSISSESEGEWQPPPSPFRARRLTTGCCFPRELFLSNFVKFPWDLLKEDKTDKLRGLLNPRLSKKVLCPIYTLEVDLWQV